MIIKETKIIQHMCLGIMRKLEIVIISKYKIDTKSLMLSTWDTCQACIWI